MDKQCKNCWLCDLADNLACEILYQMSGIRLDHLAQCPQADRERVEMNTVWGHVDGNYRMYLRFRAEPGLFLRLARNMLGEGMDTPDDIRECAAEFFNVLCGRFISEIYEVTNIPARFYPTEYEAGAAERIGADEEPLTTLYFISEEQELAEFSWTTKSVSSILKGSGYCEA